MQEAGSIAEENWRPALLGQRIPALLGPREESSSFVDRSRQARPAARGVRWGVTLAPSSAPALVSSAHRDFAMRTHSRHLETQPYVEANALAHAGLQANRAVIRFAPLRRNDWGGS